MIGTLVAAGETVGYQDGPGSDARFDTVEGAVSMGNDLYVSDAGNAVIRRVNLQTGAVSTFAGAAGKGDSVDGNLTDARFYKPGPIVAAAATLYVAQLGTEHGGACIRSIDLAGQKVSTVAGDCKRKGNLDGASGAALFMSPRAMVLDGSTLYVGDSTRIRAVALPGGTVSTVAGEPDAQCTFGLQRICKGGFTDGAGTDARLTGIRAMAISGRTLYVVDGDAVRAFDLDAKRLTTVIGRARSTGSKDGVDAQAEILNVGAILPSSGGLLLLQTTTFAGLRYLNLATKTLASLTGLAMPAFVRGSSNVDGPAAKADFKNPRHLVQAGERVLIIHDNGRIRTFEKF